MNLWEIEVKGFRSLKDVRWVPGTLNVLIGPNGSGKSNLLRALELLQDSVGGRLGDNVTRQGGFNSILWDGSAKDIVFKLKISPRLLVRHSPDNPPDAVRKWTYGLALEQDFLRAGFRIGRELLTSNFKAEPDDIILLARDSEKKVVFDDAKKSLPVLNDAVAETETLLSTTSGPIGSLTRALLRYLIESWGIYHDMQVHQEAAVRQPAVTRFEKRLSAGGQNLVPVLHTLYTEDRDFRLSIDRAMRAAFSQDFEELVFGPAGDQRIQLRVRWKSLKTPQSMPNLSDGTVRFLMLLSVLANPEPGELIAIDEPETGLHPGMFRIIAEFAAAAAEQTTVIMTTHSSQFLDAFSAHTPTTTVAQWVEGETKLSVLDGDELRRWLAEYSLGALFRSGELEGLAS